MITPVENSKIISVDLDFSDIALYNKRAFNTDMFFWTKDYGSAMLEFITDIDLVGAEISLVLENTYDKSYIFNLKSSVLTGVEKWNNFQP